MNKETIKTLLSNAMNDSTCRVYLVNDDVDESSKYMTRSDFFICPKDEIELYYEICNVVTYWPSAKVVVTSLTGQVLLYIIINSHIWMYS